VGGTAGTVAHRGQDEPGDVDGRAHRQVTRWLAAVVAAGCSRAPAPAALAVVRIGTERRADDEVARFADQRVAVEGRLVLRPPIAEPNVASATPGPTLVEPGPIVRR
jgi:hypothetical protein